MHCGVAYESVHSLARGHVIRVCPGCEVYAPKAVKSHILTSYPFKWKVRCRVKKVRSTCHWISKQNLHLIKGQQ